MVAVSATRAKLAANRGMGLFWIKWLGMKPCLVMALTKGLGEAMRWISFAVVILAAGLAAGEASAQSAVLTQVQGRVLVNSGAGFAPAGNGAAVQVGDQVSVQGPGGAVVDFGGGKSQAVPGSSTVVVRAPSAGAPVLTPSVVLGGAAVAGAVVAVVAASNNGSNTPFIPFPPVSP